MARRYYRKRRRTRKSKVTVNEFMWIICIIEILVFVVIGICKILFFIINNIIKMIKVNCSIRKIDTGYAEILDIIYTVTPRQFEMLIAELFKYSGRYDKVEITKATCDYGRDCILTKYIRGRKEVTFVEIKHYAKDNYVGRPVVQKLLGSCQMFGATKAIIVTTGKYHKNAYECQSKVNNLQLMDVIDIQKMILALDVSKIGEIMFRTLNVL